MSYYLISSIIIICILLFISYKLYELTNRNAMFDDYYIKINKPTHNNYLDGIDIIYWINLDRSTDRRQIMTQLFQDPVFQNKKIERISAVDGKIPSQVYPKINMIYKQKNNYEYACMLSHLETIRKFSNTNNETALILEDDVTLEFKPYWKNSIREIMNKAPPDWEIIQLCYITVNHNPERFNLYERNVNNKCVSAAAYLIKNSTAKQVIDSIYENGKYNLEHYINHHADCYLFTKCVTYTYKYPYFIYKTDNDSLLHPEDLGEHEYSKMKIERMYRKINSDF